MAYCMKCGKPAEDGGYLCRACRLKYGDWEDDFEEISPGEDFDWDDPEDQETEGPGGSPVNVVLLVLGIALAAVLLVAVVVGVTQLLSETEAPTAETVLQTTTAAPETTAAELTTEESWERPTQTTPEPTEAEDPAVRAIVDSNVEMYRNYVEASETDEVERFYVDPVILYYWNDSLSEIDVSDGDGEYTREYYIRYGDVYYAILRNTGGGNDETLYFQDGELIRWTDTAGKRHDRESDSAAFQEQYRWLEEAEYYYAEYWKKESVVPETTAPETTAEETTKDPAAAAESGKETAQSKETKKETTKASDTASSGESKAVTDGYILPESDSKYLTDSDVAGLSKEQLRIARNEIYARHGRRFKDPELQAYFDAQSWYNGTIDPEDFDYRFNDYERKNQDFLSEKEAEN